MGDDGGVAADKKRGTQTVRDMVLSLAVILLAAGVIYQFVPHDEDQGDGARRVDYRVEVNTARRAAPYPVAAPEGLPRDWRPTSVHYEGGGPDGAAWHLGFLTPGEEYAAVEQSDARPGPYISDVTFGAERTGRTQRIDGAEWVRYEGRKYDALVREEPGFTTVVTGTASFAQLAELAAALESGTGTTSPPASPTAAPATA
ncbi:DUF4245 domain-containing protein [Streptomyces sp. JJ36]|uniref:DUF4245 domain-containing protein n=1 Tax=Streptomyces sp. JJ36 TaxID=2736645 RepID=UPI001F3D8824|nr:DUF4245 domain-containing protein [Streptomyces sp. JJ36]MCF6521980.1 DUF4245 domain-containing protein [Streptomyces sp. JJ36]